MSDTIDIASVYENLLRTYHFSLVGYADYERRLTDFLSLVFNHPQLCPKEEFSFLLAVFAELDAGNREDSSPESIASAVDAWNTKALQDILFFSRDEKHNHELILTYYLSLLDELSKGKAKSAVNTFAKFIRKDIDVRVMVTNDDKPNIQTDSYLISLCTPRTVFRKDLWDPKTMFLDQDKVERELLDAISQSDGGEYKLISVEQQSNNKNIFRRTGGNRRSLTIPPSVTLLDPINLPKVRQAYHSQFHKPGFLNALGIRAVSSDVQEECCKAFFTIAIAGAFFASYYHVILEYVLSVCKVQDHEMLTLGGLGVGSKAEKRKQNGLDSQRRAVFSFLSDHIAANLSAQMFHDWFDLGRFAGKAHSILRSTDSPGKPFHELLEVEKVNQPTAEYAALALTAIKRERLDRVLSPDTLSNVSGYYKQLLDEVGGTRSRYVDTKEKIETNPKLLWQRLKSLAESMTLPVEFAWCRQPESTTRLHFDVEWVLLSFKTALENLTQDRGKAFDKNQFAGTPMASVEIGFSIPGKVGLEPFISQDAAASLHIVLSDNGIGCEVGTIPHGGSTGFGRWFEGKFKHVLNSHGDVWIESKGKKLSFRNPSEESNSEVDNGTRFTIVINGIGS